MKLDFKRFLSSLLAFVMTFSAMTIGNVTPTFAGTVTVGDGLTITLNKSNIGGSGGTETGSYQGLDYTISKSDSHAIYLKESTDNIKFTPDVDCTVAITSYGNPIIVDGTTIETGKTGTINATANTEYTITAGSVNNSCGVSTLEFTPSSGGGTVDPTYYITAYTDKTVAGAFTITDAASGSIVDGSDGANSISMSSTSGNTFNVSYKGPDYTFNSGSDLSLVGDTASDYSSDVSSYFEETLYTISGTVYSSDDSTTGYQPTGTITIGSQTVTVNSDGTYSVTGVTYWNGSEVSKITYTDTEDDGTSMTDVDLTDVFAAAYSGGTTTITDEDLTITIQAVAATTTVTGTLSDVLDSDLTITLTVNGNTYTAAVTAGSTEIKFENVLESDLGSSATLTASGYTFDAITSLTTDLGTVTATEDSGSGGSTSSKAIVDTIENLSDRAIETAKEEYILSDRKLSVFGKVTAVTSGNYIGNYDVDSAGYTYNGGTTYTATSGLNPGSESTTSGGFAKLMIVNLSAAGDLVIGAYGGGSETRYVSVAPCNYDEKTIDTTSAVSKGVDQARTVLAYENLSAGTYAIYVDASIRICLIGATVAFAKIPSNIDVTVSLPTGGLSEDMLLTLTAGSDTYTETVSAGTESVTFSVPDKYVGETITLTSSTHEITVDGGASQTLLDTGNTFTITSAALITYAYRVDTTGFTLEGTFTFKDSSGTELDTDGTVGKSSTINVYYSGSDYSFTGGYLSMTAGEENSSLGVTIDESTDPDTMVLTLADCTAFSKALGTTSVPRETVSETDTRTEWIYKLQSGDYEMGYLPMSETVADSGVINEGGSTIGHGENNIYAGEAYAGIDTKDESASTGENKVLFTPGTGTELIDTNGEGTGDNAKGLITTLYLPLPEDIKEGKLTVSGSVYTSEASKQWTMMQVGDIGGLRTTSDDDPVYGLRLGNGSSSNSPYTGYTLSADVKAKLWNVTTENESTINASAGWMEYEIIIDFDAKTITLDLGTAQITADYSILPSDFWKVGYIKTMTESKGQRNILVGDTTIVWEKTVASTTCAVTLDATNQTTDYYTAVVYDSDGEEVTRAQISAGTEDNTTAESLSLGELPEGDYTISYLHNGSDVSSSVDITTTSFTVDADDVTNGSKIVETTISAKATSSSTITVTITHNTTSGTYPATIYLVDSNNSPVADDANGGYISYSASQPSAAGDTETWTISDVTLPDDTYSFVVSSGCNLVSVTTQAVTILSTDGIDSYTGAVTLNALATDGLENVPWNSDDDSYYVFGSGSSANVTDGKFTGTNYAGEQTGTKYFGYLDTADFTVDSNHLNFPTSGDNIFVFTPVSDSKLVIKINNGLSFAPAVYSTSDMTTADVSAISATGEYTYYVKGGTTYTIYGLTSKQTRLQRLQLRPFTAAAALTVSVDATNKTDSDATVNIYDGTTYMESITVSANTTETISLTKSYEAGKTYTFTSVDNNIKIESQEFTIPSDATSYTATVTLGTAQGLHIVLRNAPSAGYDITFNSTTNTYDSTTYDYSYDVVAGQSYAISFDNAKQITKWPTKDWFTYDSSAKKYYVHVPSNYTDGSTTLYFDYLADPLNTLYAADNATSVQNASISYGQWGFGDDKVNVTKNDARTTVEYAGVTPSLDDFTHSYDYSARGDLKLGYDSTSSTDGSEGTVGYNNDDGTLDDNRLLINANTSSYIKFTASESGICKVDRSMKTILVHEDSASGTSVSTTTSSNGNYQFFNVTAGTTYYITGNTKTSNTHVKSIRIFPANNYFHPENIQAAGTYTNVLNNDLLKTNGNVAVTGNDTNAADDVVMRLFGYLENAAVSDSDVFDSIDYVGWTFVDKNDVDTFESNAGAGDYNPNMTQAETAINSFDGINPDDNKTLTGRSLYQAVYDYSAEPNDDGEYSYMTYGTNGPLLLRHIAASAGTTYYAYPFTVYKGTNTKSYTIDSGDKNYSNRRLTVTFGLTS